MSGVLHRWPAAMEQLLSRLRPDPDRSDIYAAEVDLTASQVKELALFEVASATVEFASASRAGRWS